MKRKTARFLGVFLLLGLLAVWSSPVSAQRFAKGDEEMQQLHEQIGAHLLVRVLELTPEQKPILLDALTRIREARDAVERQRAQIHALQKDSMRKALEALERGETPDFGALRPDVAQHEKLRQAMFELKKSLRDQIEALLGHLSEAQQETLRNFHPMALLGGTSPRDFGCSGEAGSLLDQMRFIPPPLAEQMGAKIERRAERLAAAGEAGKAEALRTFWASLLDVRALDEDAYRESREALAESLNADLVEEMQKICLNRAMKKDKKGKKGKKGKKDKEGKGWGMGPGKPCPGAGKGAMMEPPPDEDGSGPGWAWGQSGHAHRRMLHHLMLSDTFLELLRR